MDPMTQLEQQIAKELKRLPAIKAPATLAPRVLARVQARAAVPWHQRAWFQWPAPWRWASIAAMALVLAGLWHGLGQVWPQTLHLGRQWLEMITGRAQGLISQWQTALSPIGSWLHVVAPVLGYLIGLAVALAVAGMGLAGTIGLLLKRELSGK